MKTSFLYQNAVASSIETLIPVATMNEWVKGYNTVEEQSRLVQLANEIVRKIEQESGYRIGKREFILIANYFPHREVINLHPVLSITKIEYWNGSSYVELLNTKYRITKMSDKMSCLLFDSVSGLLTNLADRADAVKITFQGGAERLIDIDPMAKAAIRGYVEANFRDKMPNEVQKASEAIDRAIDNLKIWL
jgi:hypothetical protein